MHVSSWKTALVWTLGAVAASLCSCSGGGNVEAAAPPSVHQVGNVLVIVADDVGTDMVGAYHQHPEAPPTPVVDSLAANGILFRNAYACPTCSPTRAGIMTGRYGFRVGLGDAIKEWLPEPALPLSEVTLPEMLNRAGPTRIANGAIGKWHLGSIVVGGADDPNLQGFDWFEGTLGNLYNGQTYFAHEKVTNGVTTASTTYATTEQADDAIARIQAMPQPWFVYLAFNAAHEPFHAPPAYLHTYTLSGDPDATPNLHFCAAVQAMDTEIGRLLASLPPATRANTTIIFIGDNGTPNLAVIPPSVAGHSKGSLYEGGIHVPLIISGKEVEHPGAICDAFVEAVDLFPTIADLFGRDYRAGVGDDRPIDGHSLSRYLHDPAAVPEREFIFSERFSPNGFGPYDSQAWTVRDRRWKLIRRVGEDDLFFDMQGLLFEGENLLRSAMTPGEEHEYSRLETELESVIGS
jgi:arylsulfatase A-like enzyme